jgi:membrane-associated protease RseP (regulator of RpoE activity)
LSNETAVAQPARSQPKITRITERIILFSLALYALFAPHSIAITQSAFLIGLVAWAVQMAVNRRLEFRRTPVDLALLGFFACCVVSSFLSYDQIVSVKGLRSPAFFLAFYFVSSKVTSARMVRWLTLAIVVSCFGNVVASGVQIARGRGLRVDSLREDSPLAAAGIQVGDVILEADDKPVRSLDDLSRAIDEQRGPMRVQVQRIEAVRAVSVSRTDLRRGEGTGSERLGITTSPGRNFRVTGFYSHYETYAEVLQLIAALAIGLLIALPDKRSRLGWFLGSMIFLISITLLFTSTRAAMIGLTAAVACMAYASSRRRVLLAGLAVLVLAAPLAFVMVERARGINFLDPEEGSLAWRLTVWPETLPIIKDHPLFGIGKGSEGKLRDQWGLYDKGKLPPGHFHSTPIQIAVWWGLGALVLYYAMMAIFAIEMWRLGQRLKGDARWELWGVALGGLGGLVAFNVSSLVHFNFGDGEVVMMFWLLVGMTFAVRQIAAEQTGQLRARDKQAPAAEAGSQKNQPLESAASVEASARAAKAKLN